MSWMKPYTTLPLLNTGSLEPDYDSTSPYPPSSPSVSSDLDSPLSPLQTGLRASIANISETKLRAIILKLADSNPRFQRAILKELSYAQPFGESPPNTPTTAKPHKSRHRSRTRRNRKNLSVSTEDTRCDHIKSTTATQMPLHDGEPVYHPGHLEEEVYEFVSGSPHEVSFKVVRTITMWSCCDEDEWSPGCVSASAAIMGGGEIPYDAAVQFSYPDTLPDSDLEPPYETPSTPGFGGSLRRVRC